MRRQIIILMMLPILWLAACTSTPVPPQPEQPAADVEAQAETAASPAGPTATPAPVPPMVLHSSPAVGEEQALAAPVEITFDQPMDRDSVEKAFAIEPGASADGTFEWVDDQTVRFTPKDGFERGERYRVRVVGSAESQAGLALERPFELRFSAVGFLEVANVQPADGAEEILPDSIVTVLFNRPVVPLNAIEDAGRRPDPLTFVPPVRGEGEWLNTSIYQFTPAEGFEAATEYTARVSAGLTDALGNASLADDFAWTFTTVTPQVVASWPAEGDIYVSPSPVISVTFNQKMDRASVEQNFTLVSDATGDTVSGAFNWVEGGLRPPAPDEFEGYYDYAYEDGDGPEEVGVETVEFTPDAALDFGVAYHIELPQGTKGATGEAVTTRYFSAAFTVSPLPEITSTYPADGDEGVEPWQGLQVTFNAPIDPASVVIGQNVIIEPTFAVTQVYTYWWSSNTNLEIDFPGEASTRYTVSLGPGIEGRYGQPLAEGAAVSWATRAQSPLVFMHSPGRIATYNAYTDTVAYVSVRNVSQVSFKLFRLPLADFVRLNGNNWWSDWDSYQGSADAADLLAEWSLSSNGDLDSTLIYKVDIGRQSGLGEAMPPGMYYLEASADLEDIYPPAQGSQDLSSLSARQMLVVSRNNLTFKSTTSEALAWLTDLASGQPVAEVPVTFLTDGTAAGELGQATTDAEGVAQVKFDPLKEFYTTRFAITGDPADPDANFAVTASTWADGIERYQFDNVSSEDYRQPYNGNLYTDRNIYRPGQTVYFKGIIRADDDAHYSLPGNVEVATLLVTDSQGKEIFNDELPLSRMGTVNGSFDLDANAGLGFYSMQIQLAPDINFYHDFQVAAYRKPEFLVTAETDKAEYSQGEMVQVTAAAEYFFGGPVSNAEVRWTLLSSDYSFLYQGDGFYDFTDYDTSRSAVYYSSFGETLAEGEGTTDADGRITFEVEADIADKISSQRFTFDIVVTDLNNQEVASQAAAVVHKGLFYAGLQPEEYVNSANRESAVNVLVVDWESRPVARQDVQIVFAEHNWYSVQRQYEDGGFYWDSEVETIPVYTTTVTTDRAGEAVARFTPTQGGIYRVMSQATDRAGNEVRSSTFMWVSGSQYVNWRQENNDRIDLVADQREYNVGDTATILVPHPYSGTVTALVTLERGHIYDHFVTELPTNSEQLEIPITEDMLPNMYVSVTVVQGAALTTIQADDGEPISGILPSFKVGYASLPINTKEKELQITLTPAPLSNTPPSNSPPAGGNRGGITNPATRSNTLSTWSTPPASRCRLNCRWRWSIRPF